MSTLFNTHPYGFSGGVGRGGGVTFPPFEICLVFNLYLVFYLQSGKTNEKQSNMVSLGTLSYT